MIELRHLKSLIAIAEAGKLAAAAERVHLTQSALSHQVRALEDHYGITLFVRTGAGLRYAPAGRRLRASISAAWPSAGFFARERLGLASG